MSSPTTLTEQVAGEIRAEMARQRKTTLGLAAALHISQSSASRRYAGEMALDLDELDAVADWLGVPIEQLVPRRSPVAKAG